jgi:hypothetical protein
MPAMAPRTGELQATERGEFEAVSSPQNPDSATDRQGGDPTANYSRPRNASMRSKIA